jgi:hypothetical protein
MKMITNNNGYTYLEDTNVKRLLKTKDLILLTILLTAVVLSFTSSSLAIDPPAEGMVVWFKADAGVQEDGEGVTAWQDQSGNTNHANRVLGAPQLALATFPNGNHFVIRFNGDDGLRLTDATATQLTDFNIFIVASYDAGSNNKRIFGNYSVGDLGTNQYGYAFGTTGGGGSDWWYWGSSELSAVSYDAEKNYLTVYSLENSNHKELYNFHEVNGIGFGTAISYAEETGTSPIQYYTGSDPNIPPHNSDIGVLRIERPEPIYGWYGAHTGDIAEILVYDTADPDFLALADPNAAFDGVRAYVTEKYGMNTSVVPLPIEPDPDIDADLVGYWPFEETTGDITEDLSGNNNDGTLIGLDFSVNYVAGRVAGTRALQFGAAATSAVAVPASTSLNSYTAMTAMCWVKVDDFGNDGAAGTAIRAFMGNEDYTGGQYRGFAMVEYPDAHLATYADAGGGSVGITDPGTMSVDTWMMLTYTHDGVNGALYINDTQVVAPTPQPNQALATANLIFGNSIPFGPRPLMGAIDEAAFWNGALTLEEIYYVYLNGGPLPPPKCEDIGVYFPSDLNKDCYINLEDFALIANDWLKCNDPQKSECTDTP